MGLLIALAGDGERHGPAFRCHIEGVWAGGKRLVASPGTPSVYRGKKGCQCAMQPGLLEPVPLRMAHDVAVSGQHHENAPNPGRHPPRRHQEEPSAGQTVLQTLGVPLLTDQLETIGTVTAHASTFRKRAHTDRPISCLQGGDSRGLPGRMGSTCGCAAASNAPNRGNG